MGFFPNLDQAPTEEEQEILRKKGFARLFELLGRDFWKFFKAGFLALLGSIPFLVSMLLALSSHVLLFAPLGGLIGGALAGPQMCGLADTLLRSLRDEPGFWWHIYKRAWRRNAKSALLPGAAGGVLLGTEGFLLFHAGILGLNTITGAALVAGMLITLGLSLYIWPLLALMELTFPQLVKNAGLLFLGQLPRSLGALAIVSVYLGVVLRYFPLAISLLPITNFWLPITPALLLIYPGIKVEFHIEDKIRDAKQ